MSDEPNVLWVCTDQQRWDSLGCYGNDVVETPHVDRLADDGVRFERAYCQSPVCTPSRASLLTGRYPPATGVRWNGKPIPDGERLVTRHLAEAGYHCGLSGKLHLSPFDRVTADSKAVQEPVRRPDDGYAEFHWSPAPPSRSPGDEYHQWLRERGTEWGTSSVDESPYVSTSMDREDHQTTWCARKAIDCIEDFADRDEPWLFSVNPLDPHHPFDPPRAYLERYLNDIERVPLPNYEPGELADKPAVQRRMHADSEGGDHYDDLTDDDHRLIRAAYWAMVDLVDDAVGELLDALERTDQREDTLVVFTSDHGELLGDHGLYRKGSIFYEPSVRVPLVVSGPGVRTDAVSDAVVELVDLAPSLCDAAGVDRPSGMQGRSLWPLLTGERGRDDHRASAYCEAFADDERYGSGERMTMLRTDRYKLVSNHGTDGPGELYDLAEDPTETHNRWDDPEYATVQRDLLSRLTDRMSAAADPLPERRARW